MSVSSSSLLAAQTLAPFGRKPPTDNGPRALGLVQVSPKGKKARFVPIAIMMDGKFYDASAYKADPVPMALAYVGVGDNGAALSSLEKAYAGRSNLLTTLKVEPAYDPLRDDPRFQELLRRVGLAQ